MKRKQIYKELRNIIQLIKTRLNIEEHKIDLYSFSYVDEILNNFKKLFKYIEKKGQKLYNLNLIDIGVGKGWTTFLFSQFFKKVYGIDLKYTIGEQLGLCEEGWQLYFWDFFSKKQVKNNISYDFFDGYNIMLKMAHMM